jgi:hypothetical protein
LHQRKFAKWVANTEVNKQCCCYSLTDKRPTTQDRPASVQFAGGYRTQHTTLCGSLRCLYFLFGAYDEFSGVKWNEWCVYDRQRIHDCIYQESTLLPIICLFKCLRTLSLSGHVIVWVPQIVNLTKDIVDSCSFCRRLIRLYRTLGRVDDG